MSEIGKNTLGSEQLRGFVERIEKEQADIQVHKDSIGIIMAEAKAANLAPAGIKYILKRRKEKPSERAEKDSLRDMYEHAMGMAVDTPLFRAVSLMRVDIMTKESVIEAMRQFVPQNGSIVIEAGGAPVRLTRDGDGNVSVAEVVEQPVQTAETRARAPARVTTEVPDVDGDGAEALGADAFKKDNPIIANPFPFGDGRRARWDRGWRKASGGDGMGPEE